ncbi:hypothetical protein PF003_g26959 [Phytophthora fragariae]|nr:hypothetical protein PF003_g26959 [Phytophthora fragariae]
MGVEALAAVTWRVSSSARVGASLPSSFNRHCRKLSRDLARVVRVELVWSPPYSNVPR